MNSFILSSLLTKHSCFEMRVALWWLLPLLLPPPLRGEGGQGVLGVFFLLSLSSLLWCISLGKWLWWCQLTPHCHPRFVSQTHRPRRPPRHPHTSTSPHPLPATAPPLSPPPPSTLFFHNLWCFHFCSNMLFVASFWILIGPSVMMTRGAHDTWLVSSVIQVLIEHPS